LARGGAYIISTRNEALIHNINNIFLNKSWDYNLTEEMKFKPFYVYKCYTQIPIVYIFPQKIVDWYIKSKTNFPFYEYYFEPTGSTGMVFFQFMDDDFERGMQTKKEIENIFNIAQMIMYALICLVIYLLGSTEWDYRYLLAFFVLFIFSTRLFNPIGANYKLYKGQKQSIFKEGPTKDTEDDLEPFDNP
jgi:hypothetical protein